MHTARLMRILAALALLSSPAGRLRAGEPRVVDITAKRFAFTPSELKLRAWEPIVLRLHSEDVTHGFFERTLGLDATIAPGTVVDLPITPTMAGRYSVICDHFCGAGHGGMRLGVVVE